ncbi:nitroreductase family protein [Dictyobacter formicarum]|uniref:Oxidoreductase n=1 Tax=Dictyobacter formicarum TaxID=2778368 RepID=A0ABQ3VB48_9CHLR|nr:nitroreductase family protein [Dictyobacter formicarum]GHO83372.1 putative oxidoreductase [Dictyobacter formicarum]
MPQLDLTPDQLLTTTRAVRKRLDLSRAVEPGMVKECIEIAVQAPSGSNSQQWHFVVVTDAEKRKGLAELYRKSFSQYRTSATESLEKLKASKPDLAQVQQRVASSADYLAEHLHEVPVHVIPCIRGRLEGASSHEQAGVWGSILPAVWSFMLAARARGLGTAWTTLHLAYEKEAAALLGVPFEKITQTSLIPVAYTLGTDFKAGSRQPLEKIIHWNNW